MKKTDIIVPVFNEEDGIVMFYEETKKAIAGCEGFDFRFIFINDGSKDATWDVIAQLHNEYPFVKGLPLAQLSIAVGLFVAAALCWAIWIYCIPFYRYRFLWLVKAEHPEWGAGECIGACRKLMKDNMLKSFWLDCSDTTGWLFKEGTQQVTNVPSKVGSKLHGLRYLANNLSSGDWTGWSATSKPNPPTLTTGPALIGNGKYLTVHLLNNERHQEESIRILFREYYEYCTLLMAELLGIQLRIKA